MRGGRSRFARLWCRVPRGGGGQGPCLSVPDQVRDAAAFRPASSSTSREIAAPPRRRATPRPGDWLMSHETLLSEALCRDKTRCRKVGSPRRGPALADGGGGEGPCLAVPDPIWDLLLRWWRSRIKSGTLPPFPGAPPRSAAIPASCLPECRHNAPCPAQSKRGPRRPPLIVPPVSSPQALAARIWSAASLL